MEHGSGGERDWKRDHVMLYVMYCERVSFDVRHVSHIRVMRYRVHGLWYGAVPLYSRIRQLGTPPAVLTRVATILRRTRDASTDYRFFRLQNTSKSRIRVSCVPLTAV